MRSFIMYEEVTRMVVNPEDRELEKINGSFSV